jgi:glutathione synthase
VLEYPDLCPPTIVTRETTRLRSFIGEQGGEIVVKPLDSSGGFGVFHVRKGDPNTGAILEQATQLGRRWTMAQKYLPEVARATSASCCATANSVRGAARPRARRRAQPARRRQAMATKLDDRDTEIARARPAPAPPATSSWA